MLTCCILDNDPDAIEALQQYISQNPVLQLLDAGDAPEEALQKIAMDELAPDITFLDIAQINNNLQELAAGLKRKTNLIVITDNRNYGPEAFLLNAVDYILKPVSYHRFLQAIDKAAKQPPLPQRVDRPYIFIPGDKKGLKIKIVKAQIRYIKAYANYIKIVTEGKQYMTYISLNEVLELLSDSSFVRVHKSYIINMHKVSTIDPVSVCLECGTIIPIGNVFKASFLKRVIGV